MTEEELLEAVGRIEKSIVDVADLLDNRFPIGVDSRMRCIAALREAQELRMDIKEAHGGGRKYVGQKA